MRILVYANQQEHEWREMLRAYGHSVTLLPVGAYPISQHFDACLLLNLDPNDLLFYRSWLEKLPAPALLITTALLPAQLLRQRFPLLRMVCHPSRAASVLDQLLAMLTDVRSGVAVFGPLFELARSDGQSHSLTKRSARPKRSSARRLAALPYMEAVQR